MEVNANAAPDKRSYKVDFGLFASLAPTHQPRVSLKATIEQLRDLLSASGFADKDFRQSRFMRLNMLSHLVSTGRFNANLDWQRRGQHSAVV